MPKRNDKWRDAYFDLDAGCSLTETAEKYGMTKERLSNNYNHYKRNKEIILNNPGEEFQRIIKAENKLSINRYKNTLRAKELNKTKREISLYEVIREEISKQNLKLDVKYKPIKKQKKESKWNGKLLVLSDFHFMEGDENFFDSLISDIKSNLKKDEEVFLALLGDYIENKMHADQIQNITSPITQVQKITSFLIKLLKEIKPIKVFMVAGNHDRIAKNKLENPRKETWAKVIYNTLNTIFKDSIQFEYDDLFIRTSFPFSNESHVLFIHGDIVKSSNQLNESWIRNYEDQTGMNIQYTFAGHFHKFGIYDRKGTGKKTILCPATKNPYQKENTFEVTNNLRSTIGYLLCDFSSTVENIKFRKYEVWK